MGLAHSAYFHLSSVAAGQWIISCSVFTVGLQLFLLFLSYQDPTWISLKWRQRCLTWRLQVFWQLARFWQDEIVFCLEFWISIFLTFFDIVDTRNENCWLSHGLNFTIKLFSGIAKFASVLHIQMLLNKMYLPLFSWLCFISYCLISYQKFTWTPCISLNYGKNH